MSTRNHIEAAMRNSRIIYTIVAVLVAFGIFALGKMKKDEFPEVTIRQGLIVAIFPGATAQEVEEQVAKPIEQYLFTFKEIDKRKTYSLSKDGMCYIFAALSPKVTNSNEAWSKIRGGISLLKQMQLPTGMLAVAVIDDFGNTSSILLAMESTERSPRELQKFAEMTADRLREIEEMGSIKLLGQQYEEIAVTLDVERISKYSIDQNVILARLASQGFRTMTGEVDNEMGAALVHVDVPYRTEYEVGEQIIFTDPVNNQTIRLKDIAQIERRYEEATKYVRRYDEHGVGDCLLLNIEMQSGNNIVAFGAKVDEILEQMRATLPPDVQMHKITNQPRVVDSSVRSFLKDLVVSVLIVIAVMLVLFPLRTALVSSTGLPVCIAITIGIMYLFGIELNTVTLAALIVVLGMVVDDSVIVIDGYSDLLAQGHSRWYAAAVSTRDLFVPMVLATTSISGMFFPMLGLMTGSLADFIKLFPWAIFIALTCSILYAVWIIPYMASTFIRRKPVGAKPTLVERTQEKFFAALQAGYQKLLDLCFRHPWWTIGISLGSVVLGTIILTQLDIQLMPKADRDSFAVEIHLTEGSSLEQTQAIVDSLGGVLNADKRVQSVTAFVGMSSPRFHATYAPQMGGKNYAQFIVNTISPEATFELIEHYQPLYENAFPNAYCRFKMLDYQAVNNPIEVYVQGSDIGKLEVVADSVKTFLAQFPNLTWVHTDYDETVQTIRLRLKDDEASRLGITQASLSVYLNGLLHGRGMTSIWEDGYKTPVVLYSLGVDSLDYGDIGNLMIPTLIPKLWVPLRQIADIEPDFHHAQIKRRNSVRTITVSADTRGKLSAITATKPVIRYVHKLRKHLPDGVSISFGGALEQSLLMLPGLISSIGAALLVLLVLLVYHFRKLNISFLALSSSLLCLFGSAVGMWMFHMDISVTAILGVISLIGIIVRNAIIMYEYSDHLVSHEHKTAREAAYLAGQRRMRPIFLTTATTALGVVPMILAATDLWMPMGVVICFGAILTMPMVVTLLPVAYWKLFEKSTRRYEK